MRLKLPMKFNIGGFSDVSEKIRSNDVYDVYDLKALNNIVVSMTVLHGGKCTSGHYHDKEEEVYMFLEGSGEMQLGDDRFAVSKGDVVLINGGRFHKVFNTGKDELKFFCVFEKYQGR